MNAGRRLVRNTVFGLWGAAALFVGLNRLAATPAGEGKDSFLTLGLRQDREPQRDPEIDLATARGFTRLSVRGPLRVEVVGAGAYKVTLTASSGQSPQVHAYLKEGVLHVDGGEGRGAMQGVLRVEVPTLQRIDAASAQLVVRALHAPELSLFTYGGGVATLEQNHVQRWHVFSSNPLELRVDDATFAAGSLKANADVVIRRAP